MGLQLDARKADVRTYGTGRPVPERRRTIPSTRHEPSPRRGQPPCRCAVGGVRLLRSAGLRALVLMPLMIACVVTLLAADVAGRLDVPSSRSWFAWPVVTLAISAAMLRRRGGPGLPLAPHGGARFFLLMVFMVPMLAAAISYPVRVVAVGTALTVALMVALAFIVDSQLVLGIPSTLITPGRARDLHRDARRGLRGRRCRVADDSRCRPADGRAEPHRARGPRRRARPPGDGRRAAASRCSSATSTASRRSTTSTATPSATRSCGTSPTRLQNGARRRRDRLPLRRRGVRRAAARPRRARRGHPSRSGCATRSGAARSRACG